MFMNIVENKLSEYKSATVLRYYDAGALSGAVIYEIKDGAVYCYELFIESANKLVFRRWWRFWQTLSDKCRLKTMKTNEKLIQFLKNQGFIITGENGNFITMEGVKHG